MFQIVRVRGHTGHSTKRESGWYNAAMTEPPKKRLDLLARWSALVIGGSLALFAWNATMTVVRQSLGPPAHLAVGAIVGIAIGLSVGIKVYQRMRDG